VFLSINTPAVIRTSENRKRAVRVDSSYNLFARLEKQFLFSLNRSDLNQKMGVYIGYRWRNMSDVSRVPLVCQYLNLFSDLFSLPHRTNGNCTYNWSVPNELERAPPILKKKVRLRKMPVNTMTISFSPAARLGQYWNNSPGGFDSLVPVPC
jgi:hypothetical protein